MEKKITKKDILVAIGSLISSDAQVNVEDVVVTGVDIAEYITKTIEQLNNKAYKAKERAASKKNEEDELKNAITEILTDDFQTVNDILNQLNMEDVTKSKIVARLSQLIKAGMAHKTLVKTADGKKIMGYAAGPEVTESDVE